MAKCVRYVQLFESLLPRTRKQFDKCKHALDEEIQELSEVDSKLTSTYYTHFLVSCNLLTSNDDLLVCSIGNKLSKRNAIVLSDSGDGTQSPRVVKEPREFFQCHSQAR